MLICLYTSSCVAAASRAAWCTPTSLSRRSSRAKQVKTPRWTSREKWLYDRDTGFYYFYANEQENSWVRLLFMEYFSSKGEELMGMVSWPLPACVSVEVEPCCHDSCCCHGYETLQRDCGWIFFRCCFLFKYLYFDTVLVSTEKKGTWNQWYLSYICWYLDKLNI